MVKASLAAPIARMDPDEQPDIGDDFQLDLVLNHFLEADLASLHQYDNDLIEADHHSDDIPFTDISDSIDIPDLHFHDSHRAPAGGDTKPGTTTADEVFKAETAQPTQSLLVVIPASALVPPSSSDPRSKPKAAKPTWSQIWSKRQKAVKDELLSLHQQVAKLERKLEQLRQNARVPTELERVLTHETVERQRSEAENATLKRMLEHELETTRRLSMLLRKCQDISVDDIDV